MKEVLNNRIKSVAKDFIDILNEKEVMVISHFDTDGITSAAIMARSLKRFDKKFNLKILKGLTEDFIDSLPEDKIIIFLDLASNTLDKISQSKNKFFIIDHHEINQEIPSNVSIVNPHLHNNERISSSGLTYLFCKEMDERNSEFAKLAVLGMIGDRLESEVDKLNNLIVNESEIKKKRGLLIYPSTRPINRTLEFSSNPYIPGVTGNPKGVLEFLRECGIQPSEKGYKSLLELDESEMKKLVTGISLRNREMDTEKIIGDIFLIKFYNKLEDARELSAKINACSRLDEPEVAIQFCLEIPSAKKKVDSIHIKYKQHIISALKFVSDSEKISGEGFLIINAKNNVKDTIIGTIASIISSSAEYKEGTTIITMANYENKIKISARNVGRSGRNVRDLLSRVISQVGGEFGGHEFAAGCLIEKENETNFIEILKKEFEIEVIRV